MKILFPMKGISVGGSHLSTIELYKGLIAHGVDAVILLHVASGPLSNYLENKKIPYETLPVKTLAGNSHRLPLIFIGILRNFLKFRNYINKNNIDLVHGNDLFINLAWSIPARLFSKGYIWHQRTILSSSPLWRLLSLMCNKLIATSRTVFDSIPGTIDKNKKSLIWNPISTGPCLNKNEERTLLHEQYGVPSDRLLIGYVGRLVEYKQVHFLIQNLPKVKLIETIKFHLIIAGTGDEKYCQELKQLIASLNMEDNVTFTGFIQDPAKLIAALDVLVTASPVDAFGRTLAEAMLLKTSVLASNSGGHAELISDGITGFLFDPNDGKDFSEKLQILGNDKIIREKITNTAYKWAQGRFLLEDHVDNILSVYKNIITHKS